MRCPGFLLCACCSLLAGQTVPPVPVYEYTGAPLAIPYVCNDEDIEWAGLTCVDESCPIYVDLTGVAGQAKSILIAGNFHAPSATMYSLLLRSEDGGRTWREPFPRIRGAELDGLQVYDAQTAWINGQIQQPVAIDPFFLITRDGGANWDRIPLFEEGTPGSIMQFVFDSRDHGLVAVDRGGGELRYETYETDSGGHSWSMREKSGKPPKLKLSAESEWRIKAESRLFRLEHLEESRWSPFASFAIRAAECRLKPPEERPEPPSETGIPAKSPDDAVNEIRLGAPPPSTKKPPKP